MPRWVVNTLVSAEYTGQGAGRPRSAACCGSTEPAEPISPCTRVSTSYHEAGWGPPR